MTIEPLAERFAAFGWAVHDIDGHDVDVLLAVLDNLPPPGSERPTCIIARTVKGKGVDFMERAPQAWHIGCLDPAQREEAVRQIRERMRVL
jgi:transketolase